jgi:hypothetical protein
MTLVFFKQVKQTLKLGSFLGHSANAVRWQIYTPLLVYVLLRFMAHLADWGHSFTRLFAETRSALWERIDLLALLKSYGTASDRNSRHISAEPEEPAIAIPQIPPSRPCQIKASGSSRPACGMAVNFILFQLVDPKWPVASWAVTSVVAREIASPTCCQQRKR